MSSVFILLLGWLSVDLDEWELLQREVLLMLRGKWIAFDTKHGIIASHDDASEVVRLARLRKPGVVPVVRRVDSNGRLVL